MRIGIIGTGEIGGTLTRKLTLLRHTVFIANSRGLQSTPAVEDRSRTSGRRGTPLAELAKETGARPFAVTEAVKNVDLVIVAIPEKNVPDLPKGLFGDLPNHVAVIDTGNYYPYRDGYIAAIEQGATDSRWVSSVLGRPVVKAFNNIMARSLADGGRTVGAKDRIALPVAGDDPGAKSVVLALVDALGFDGVDAGSLDESWRQQPGTPVYCTDLDANGVRHALRQADRGNAPEMRDRGIAELQKLPAGSTHEQQILALRRVQWGVRAPSSSSR